MKVYEATYNPMTHESASYTISIHKTKKGARDALAKFLREKKKRQDKYQDGKKPKEGETFYFFQTIWYRAWGVHEIELLD